MYLSEYQTVEAYEQALEHHAQFVRWMKAIPCTCITETGQPQISCPYCRGRGFFYKPPVKGKILNELAHCNYQGEIFLQHNCVSGSAVVLDVVTQQAYEVSSYSGNQIVLTSAPNPATLLNITYEIDFTTNIVSDSCAIVDIESTYLVVKPSKVSLTKKGQEYQGTIVSVSSVVVDGVSYSAADIQRDLITVNAAATSSSIVTANYMVSYPQRLLVHSISEKMKWQDGYAQEEADAIVVVPYYVKASNQDLFTIMSAKQVASVIVDPTQSVGNDVIGQYYDIAELLALYNPDGSEIDISQVSIYNRNEIKWAASKPTTRYTVQLSYHPTFAVIPTLPTLRSAQDDQFVNKLNVVEFSRMSKNWTF